MGILDQIKQIGKKPATQPAQQPAEQLPPSFEGALPEPTGMFAPTDALEPSGDLEETPEEEAKEEPIVVQKPTVEVKKKKKIVKKKTDAKVSAPPKPPKTQIEQDILWFYNKYGQTFEAEATPANNDTVKINLLFGILMELRELNRLAKK